MLKTNYNVYSDELYHHGIQGQKLGQRNGPPYPLSQGMRTAAERKENKKSSYTHPEVEAKKVKKAKRGSYGGGAEKAKQQTEVARRLEEKRNNNRQAYNEYVDRFNALDAQYSDYKMAKREKLFSKEELKEMKKDYKQSKKDFNEAYKADKKAIKEGYRDDEIKKEKARKDAYDSLSTKEKANKFINETAHSLTKSAASFVADMIGVTEDHDKIKKATEILGESIDKKWNVDKYNKNVKKNMKKAGVVDTSSDASIGRVW